MVDLQLARCLVVESDSWLVGGAQGERSEADEAGGVAGGDGAPGDGPRHLGGRHETLSKAPKRLHYSGRAAAALLSSGRRAPSGCLA